MDEDQSAELLRRLGAFVTAEDRSSRAVARMEELVLALRDNRIAELGPALAMWHPEGGEYLYDDGALSRVAREALHDLDDHQFCQHLPGAQA